LKEQPAREPPARARISTTQVTNERKAIAEKNAAEKVATEVCWAARKRAMAGDRSLSIADAQFDEMRATKPTIIS
jgi:hypothetical protein